jgi:C-terminal processing protease CtpA/Prc
VVVSAMSRKLLLALAMVAAAAGAAAPAAAQQRCPPAAASDLPALPAPTFLDGPEISVAGLHSDFERWLADMAEINPDLSIRTDAAGLAQEAASIRSAITEPMTPREAWALFARINPHLRDGHSGIAMPQAKEALEAHVNHGGRTLPFEVRFARDGSLRILSALAPDTGLTQGDRLISINGVSGEDLVEQMLARVPGETDRFRRASLSRRFGAHYWFLFGDTGQYDIAFADRRGCLHTVRLDGAARLPVALQPNPAAQDLFEARVLPGRIGYLRVDTFAHEQEAALASFAATAFAQFRTAHVRALIIDVRENGGGDDPLWQNSIMNYITSQPYSQLSRFALRITRQNADPGDIIGDVQRSEYTRRRTPPENVSDRFTGPVYVLGGPFSYSATIQFMVAAQDFRVARIAGEETGALSCQTGQVRPIDMRHTGLFAFTPLIAYTRPSGAGCDRGILPDAPVEIDEVRPDRTLESLAARIRNGG